MTNNPNGGATTTHQDAPATGGTVYDQSSESQSATKPPVGASRPKTLQAELRGSLAQRREYDLWLIGNVRRIVRGGSLQERVLTYCMTTVYGAERLVASTPEHEYALQADGTVLITPGGPPKTMEQMFRDDERNRYELENGGGSVVQACAGSLSWFGTWQNKPMPTNEKFIEAATKAEADLRQIDNGLDPRLLQGLPRAPADNLK